MEPIRRRSGGEPAGEPTTYAAVGGTQAADLLAYPPAGFRPIERRVRIGHGPERFEAASLAVLSWQVQLRSGMTVDVESRPDAEQTGYRPVGFDEEGAAVEPAALERSEVQYGPDGSELLAAGETVRLGIPFLLWRVGARARVVYVIDEPTVRGFAYGTLKGHPESGEEAFLVELHDDGSVWFVVRAFSRGATRLYRLVGPVLRITQWVYTRRYLRALLGPTEERGSGKDVVRA